MSKPITIDKNRTLLSSQDYSFLREQGLEYIRSLSGKIWTDHNLHDPGITILEILCYALTDLGYRTGFDIKDLLAAEDGSTVPTEQSGLFPAHEIMTIAPLTIPDYRRLLLKIEGVRNAWLDPMGDSEQEAEDNYRESEIPIYVDRSRSLLSLEDVNQEGLVNGRVRLRGLYKVLLELEIDEDYGSLNERRLLHQVNYGPLKGVVLSIDSGFEVFPDNSSDLEKDFDSVVAVVKITPDRRDFRATVEVKLEGVREKITLRKLMIGVVNNIPDANRDPIEVRVGDVEELLGANGADNIIRLFWAKHQKRAEVLTAVDRVLHAHRNLCEDLLSIEAVSPERVAFCGDIELTGAADLEEMQARVYHAIEEYFNPPIKYYTLGEMLDEGLCSDEIFNGPYIDWEFKCGDKEVFTKPGFIKTENLEESELRRILHISDIVNILMDFEEIVAVRNLMFRKYNADDEPIGDSERWCMEITPNHQPILHIMKSKITFFKDRVPYLATITESQETLDQYRAMSRKKAYVEPNQVLELPRGRYRHPESYFTIQHDFPKTYGIGEVGLPATADNKRIAKARQLKAYLTFYDQVLADYLAQLGNIRKLFSLDPEVSRTYYSQYLSDIARVRNVPADGPESEFADEFYVNKALLENEDSRNRLTESNELFLDRRNRFLDHLAARFSEQFSDYVMMMYSLEGSLLKTGKEVILDKIDFLRNYPIVSRERGKGFNFRPENPLDVWDCENVAGVQRRVSRMIGIDDYSPRPLACAELADLLFNIRQVSADEWLVEIKAADDTTIFESEDPLTEMKAKKAVASLFPHIREESTYQVDDSGGTDQVCFTIRHGRTSLKHKGLFETEADAVQQIRSIIDRYDEILQTHSACDNEGFYLLEHILLRPFTKSEKEKLMSICVRPSGNMCGDEDPYSFRITVALPYWPERFQQMKFRRYFEQTLRKETPAHIHARICWIDNAQMALLDEAYINWVDQKAVAEIEHEKLTEASSQLIKILQNLKTVYPVATLHDCAEGEDESPVQLGSTNLGIF
jgi:hypothetical protein